MKKKILALCLVVAMLAIAIVGGTLAYFTAKEVEDNKFVIGDIDIDLKESNGDVKEDDAYKTWLEEQTLFPGAPIAKNVWVENIGANDAYVRVKITVPAYLVAVWAEKLTDAWTIASTTVNADKSTNYVLTYNTILAAGAKTPICLEKITIDPFTDNQINGAAVQTVNVVAEAIQTVGFENNPAAAFAALDQQLAVNDMGGVQKVDDAAEAKNVLTNGGYAQLTDDVAAEAEAGGYNKAGLTQTKGGVLDGNGKELDVSGANDTWDCGIYTNGGTIKNLKLSGSFRGIFSAGASEDLYVENVIIDNVCYTISVDYSGPVLEESAYLTNCTLNGWTSYSNMFRTVIFTDCTFGQGTGSYTYAFCRPYGVTEFVNCDFEAGYEIDPRAAVSFENCTIDGQPLTDANLDTLVISNIQNASVK